MALWHLASQSFTSLLLWRTGSSSFRVMRYDEPAEVLTNLDYVLVDKKYEDVLRTLVGQVELAPVTVSDNVRHLVWGNYLEVRICRSVDADTIYNHAERGLDLYCFGGEHLFVSVDLKAELEKVHEHGLCFSSGLSEFG